MVFTSTLAVYGHGEGGIFDEDQQPSPIDPYGVAKYACEMDIQIAAEQHGLDYCIIRPHNVYGINQNIWDKYAGYITGFPDSEFLIVNLFGNGDQLVKHWNFKGTHAESGKKVNVYGATLVKMKDGKIFQEQDYWDARKFYKQLSE